MVLVSVSIHEAKVSSSFFGVLKASRRWKLKKIIILENIKSNELSLVFSKIVSKGLCCDKVWRISIFPFCTPIRGIYRKSFLIGKAVMKNLLWTIHWKAQVREVTYSESQAFSIVLTVDKDLSRNKCCIWMLVNVKKSLLLSTIKEMIF